MIARLRQSDVWQLFVSLPRADARLTTVWWLVLVARGVLPAIFGIAMGVLVAAVQRGQRLDLALALAGGVFVAVQVLAPVHKALGQNLGDRAAAWLYGQLTEACVEPRGLAHLEDPQLVGDLTLARDFDLGHMGPPLSISIDFIADGLVTLFVGIASTLILVAFHWWAPLLLGLAWGSTHWLLSESAVWRDRNTEPVRAAQREADYTYRLAVDPPASKELRLFGLADWALARFTARRTQLYELQHAATRLRERPLVWCVLIVSGASLAVFWTIGAALSAGTLSLARAVVFAQSAVGASAIAFGGLNWALDGAAAPFGAVRRLRAAMAKTGMLASGSRDAGTAPIREIRFRDVSFAYPGGQVVLDRFDLTIPARSSLAIVGQNGAGKTTLAKLICRFYDPQAGAIEADGVDIREFTIESWRSRVTAVFQDFARFELPLRDNVAPAGAADDTVRQALQAAGAATLASLDTPLARGYEGGTELSGGQWQRIALARALCAVRQGSGVILLDEPTAQLDVRGEGEIFERVLHATRHCTTILISHRFSTVRQADRICVLEAGRVIELGTHDELMSSRGRYHTMFELQAARFASEDEEGRVYDVLA